MRDLKSSIFSRCSGIRAMRTGVEIETTNETTGKQATALIEWAEIVNRDIN